MMTDIRKQIERVKNGDWEAADTMERLLAVAKAVTAQRDRNQWLHMDILEALAALDQTGQTDAELRKELDHIRDAWERGAGGDFHRLLYVAEQLMIQIVRCRAVDPKGRGSSMFGGNYISTVESDHSEQKP